MGLRLCEVFVLLVAALATGVALTAYAEEPTVREARRLTSATEDTGCIGTPISPVRALETLFACTLRRDTDLCYEIGLSLSPPDAKELVGNTPGPDGLA